MAATGTAGPDQAEPMTLEVAAAEPLVEQPAATPAAAGSAGDASAEQTAVLPVVAGQASASEAQEPAAVDAPQADSKPKDDPVKIGYKVFQSADAALRYYYDLVKCLRREQDINEYEHKMVLDLLERGHPAAAQKIGCGVAAFQILRHSNPGVESDCFFVIRTDGSREDFSIRKSVAGLFPVYGKSIEGRPLPSNPPSRGRGGRRGGRGGGRDGGRGGGRGRGGRGFRARGRGRRGRGRG